jgi:hypothetical protein
MYLATQLFEKGGEVRYIQDSKASCLIVAWLGLVTLVDSLPDIAQWGMVSRVRISSDR